MKFHLACALARTFSVVQFFIAILPCIATMVSVHSTYAVPALQSLHDSHVQKVVQMAATSCAVSARRRASTR